LTFRNKVQPILPLTKSFSQRKFECLSYQARGACFSYKELSLICKHDLKIRDFQIRKAIQHKISPQ